MNDVNLDLCLTIMSKTYFCSVISQSKFKVQKMGKEKNKGSIQDTLQDIWAFDSLLFIHFSS